MKIAMLGHKRIPSREGGVEIVVEEIGSRLVKRGHSVTCYNRRGHHVSGKEFDSKSIKNYKGISLKNVFSINFKGLSALTSSIFASIRCAVGSYDVVHFHAEGPCAMIWLPKLFGKRCIATIHGLDHQRAKWGKFAQKYILFGEKMAVKYADEIIVLSNNNLAYFNNNYNRKTIYIPNGVLKPNRIEPEIIKKYSLDKDSYLLYLGRIVPEKGLENLVKAFMKVNTDKKLVIAGGASDTDDFMYQLKELSKNDDRILFTGFVQGKILEELYSNAYIYILPSELEGMPLSLLEAMSYGNCCLVSDIPECVEMVEDKALHFACGNIDDLREKIQYLCDDESSVLYYKGEAADYICNKYSWETTTCETEKLYYKQV